MKQSEYKNFKAGLADARSRRFYECLGWAFLRLTDRQTIDIMAMYWKENLVDIERKEDGRIWVRFGTDHQYTILQPQFEEMCRKYNESFYYDYLEYLKLWKECH